MERYNRSAALILFCFVILLMSWEGQKIDASALKGVIPQESIRLRILANSDSPGDQVIKRQVRDAIVEQMNGWVAQLDNPLSLEEAREVIRLNLSEIEQTVAHTLQESNKNYGYKVELGLVSFPTKIYGGAVYPAGEYEALRVTLGEGKGKNWWCVLFPPLCFIDAGSGDALANKSGKSSLEEEETSTQDFGQGNEPVLGQGKAKEQEKKSENKNEKNEGKDGQGQSKVEDQGEADIASADISDGKLAQGERVQVEQADTEVRFFVWDMLTGLWDRVTGWFA